MPKRHKPSESPSPPESLTRPECFAQSRRHTPSESFTQSIEVAATLAAIDSLQGTLTMARALVLSGREVELEGLDREAARLCAAVACMPGDSGQALLPSLIGLTREVDALSVCIPEP